MGHSFTIRALKLSVALTAMTVLGCGAEPGEPAGSEISARSPSLDASISMPTAATPPAETSKADKNPQDATAGRKIIYNANINLVTEDLNKLENSLTQLIAKQKAYIADSERSGAAGSTRRGTWKVRVPVDGYDSFVKAVLALGELVSVKADSQDVSEEYYDLEARQTAKKVEEARLLKHLSDSTGKLDEILAVERELSRVRGEIERMQGRLRALSNLTTLATVTINVSEVKDYVPPQAPTLSTRVTRTFAVSLDTLRQFGEAVLLFVVGALPWLPLIALVLGPIIWSARRSSRREEVFAIGPAPSDRPRDISGR